ncbi:hypothetical protein [Agrobacterium tumefaciens]
MHAGQTAKLKVLCEILIEKGLLERAELVYAYHDALSQLEDKKLGALTAY